MKKCPKCGKLYDAQSSICLGLFCAHAELINFSKEVTRVFDKAVEDNALKPKEENFGEVHYDD